MQRIASYYQTEPEMQRNSTEKISIYVFAYVYKKLLLQVYLVIRYISTFYNSVKKIYINFSLVFVILSFNMFK